MSAPGGQDHREETIAQVAWHIDKCCTGGTDNDWVGAEAIVSDVVAPLEAELDRLRSALEEITKWAEAARSHYGIEECSGPGQPGTEWDEVQDGLRAAAMFAREALGERT